MSSFPKLRTDLVIGQQETREGKFFVFKDPGTRRFFRFREPEYFIARQLDGATDVEVIGQRVEERFGATLVPGQIDQFVTQLGRLGLIETDVSATAPPGPQQRVLGSLLYLRFKAFDPNGLLTRLGPKVRLFFTPHFLVLSAVSIACAFAITVVEWNAIVRDFRGLWRFDALLVAWVTVLLVTVCHEFAHGLTCRHFGGEVREMGFMLIYFQPALYCNVSDAWLFPERWKRLWVTFAGAYFEMFLWSLATLAWRIVEPGTWISFVALVVMATSGIKWIFNFNPLIKLDGYYLLSDYLEIPNLRSKAVGYLTGRLKAFWGWRGPQVAAETARQRRIYLLYGALAFVYSYWLLSYIAVAFGRYLVAQYQGVGFMIFAGVLGITFRHKVTAPFSKVAAALRARAVKPSTVAWAASPLVLMFLFLGRMELTVPGEFRVLPLHNADVRAEVEGIIDKVYVDEGDRVKVGDLVASLSDRALGAELEKTSAEIAERGAQLKRLRTGTRSEEIQLARTTLQAARRKLEASRAVTENLSGAHGAQLAKATSAVEKASARFEYAQSSLERSRRLAREGLISRQQFERSQEEVVVRQRELEEAEAELTAVSSDDLAEPRRDLAAAEGEVDEARATLALLLAGTRPEEIEAAEAQLAGLEAHLHYLEEQLQHTRIVSPITGIVTTPSLELREKLGQHVKKGDLIAEVHDLQTIVAELAVSEKEIADVEVGQPVVVRARAYPGTEFEGTVRSIAASVTAREEGWGANTWMGDPVVLVTTELHNTSLRLKPGMNGYAKISCGRRRIVHLITRRLAGYIRTEFWSWW